METVTIPLHINRGEDWAAQIVFTDDNDEPLKLVNPARMDIKTNTGTIICTLNTVDDPPDFTEEIPGVVISTAIGLVQLSIDSTVTDALPVGTFVYDLFAKVDDGDEYAGDQIVRLIKGPVNIENRITETF